MPKITETVIVQIPVEITYEDRKGAREVMLRELRLSGPRNSWGCNGTCGGFSTKVLTDFTRICEQTGLSKELDMRKDR